MAIRNHRTNNRQGLVCVSIIGGGKKRLPHNEAEKLVNAGKARYIPKWMYKEAWVFKRGNLA